MTLQISIIAVLFIVTFILAGVAFAVLDFDKPWAYFLGTSVWRVSLLAIVIFVLSLFVRPRMQRRFPFFVWKWKSSSKPSHPTDGTTELTVGPPMVQEEEENSMSSSSSSKEEEEVTEEQESEEV